MFREAAQSPRPGIGQKDYERKMEMKNRQLSCRSETIDETGLGLRPK